MRRGQNSIAQTKARQMAAAADDWKTVQSKKARTDDWYEKTQVLSGPLVKGSTLQQAIEKGEGGLLATEQRDLLLDLVAAHLESNNLVKNADGETVKISACFALFGDVFNPGSWFCRVQNCADFFKQVRGGAVMFLLWHPNSYVSMQKRKHSVAAAFRTYLSGVVVIPKSAFDDEFALKFLAQHENGFSIPSASFDTVATEFFFGNGAFSLNNDDNGKSHGVRWDDRLKIQTTPCLFLALRRSDRARDHAAVRDFNTDLALRL